MDPDPDPLAIEHFLDAKSLEKWDEGDRKEWTEKVEQWRETCEALRASVKNLDEIGTPSVEALKGWADHVGIEQSTAAEEWVKFVEGEHEKLARAEREEIHPLDWAEVATAWDVDIQARDQLAEDVEKCKAEHSESLKTTSPEPRLPPKSPRQSILDQEITLDVRTIYWILFWFAILYFGTKAYHEGP